MELLVQQQRWDLTECQEGWGRLKFNCRLCRVPQCLVFLDTSHNEGTIKAVTIPRVNFNKTNPTLLELTWVYPSEQTELFPLSVTNPQTNGNWLFELSYIVHHSNELLLNPTHHISFFQIIKKIILLKVNAALAFSVLLKNNEIRN